MLNLQGLCIFTYRKFCAGEQMLLLFNWIIHLKRQMHNNNFISDIHFWQIYKNHEFRPLKAPEDLHQSWHASSWSWTCIQRGILQPAGRWAIFLLLFQSFPSLFVTQLECVRFPSPPSLPVHPFPLCRASLCHTFHSDLSFCPKICLWRNIFKLQSTTSSGTGTM